jgi:hypothetical protein
MSWLGPGELTKHLLGSIGQGQQHFDLLASVRIHQRPRRYPIITLPVGGPAPTAHRRNRLHVINGVAHRGVSARSGSRGQPPTLAGLGTRNQYRLHLVNTHLPSSVPSRSLGGVPTPSARLPVHRSLRGGEQADSRETQGNIHAEDLGCCSIRHLWSQRLIGRITRGCLPRPTAFMDSRWHAPGLRSWMDKSGVLEDGTLCGKDSGYWIYSLSLLIRTKHPS